MHKIRVVGELCYVIETRNHHCLTYIPWRSFRTSNSGSMNLANMLLTRNL